MPLKSFDHVNLQTANLDAMVDWYDRVLGLKAGPRPDFGFPGAWLYLGDLAIVHLVGVEATPRNDQPQIEHFAIAAEGLAEFRALCGEQGVEVREARVVGTDILQLNVFDPDGNHIHIDFDLAAEGP